MMLLPLMDFKNRVRNQLSCIQCKGFVKGEGKIFLTKKTMASSVSCLVLEVKEWVRGRRS